MRERERSVEDVAAILLGDKKPQVERECYKATQANLTHLHVNKRSHHFTKHLAMKQCWYKSSISSQEESTELGGARGSHLNGYPRSKDLKMTGVRIMWRLNIKMPISGA